MAGEERWEVVLSSPRRPGAVAVSVGLLILLVAAAILADSVIVLLLFGVPLIWRVVAAPTRLWVDERAITVEAPAVLRSPLRIDRDSVHSVYVFPDRRRPRSGPGSVGGVAVQQAAAEPTCWWAPDMVVGVEVVGVDRPGLLIVLDPSLPMRDAVRRHTSALLLFGS